MGGGNCLLALSRVSEVCGSCIVFLTYFLLSCAALFLSRTPSPPSARVALERQQAAEAEARRKAAAHRRAIEATRARFLAFGWGIPGDAEGCSVGRTDALLARALDYMDARKPAQPQPGPTPSRGAGGSAAGSRAGGGGGASSAAGPGPGSAASSSSLPRPSSAKKARPASAKKARGPQVREPAPEFARLLEREKAQGERTGYLPYRYTHLLKVDVQSEILSLAPAPSRYLSPPSVPHPFTLTSQARRAPWSTWRPSSPWPRGRRSRT